MFATAPGAEIREFLATGDEPCFSLPLRSATSSQSDGRGGNPGPAIDAGRPAVSGGWIKCAPYSVTGLGRVHRLFTCRSCCWKKASVFVGYDGSDRLL